MFESPTTLPTARSSSLAVSTKYGLTFVGCPTGILKLLCILEDEHLEIMCCFFLGMCTY